MYIDISVCRVCYVLYYIPNFITTLRYLVILEIWVCFIPSQIWIPMMNKSNILTCQTQPRIHGQGQKWIQKPSYKQAAGCWVGLWKSPQKGGWFTTEMAWTTHVWWAHHCRDEKPWWYLNSLRRNCALSAWYGTRIVKWQIPHRTEAYSNHVLWSVHAIDTS